MGLWNNPTIGLSGVTLCPVTSLNYSCQNFISLVFLLTPRCHKITLEQVDLCPSKMYVLILVPMNVNMPDILKRREIVAVGPQGETY